MKKNLSLLLICLTTCFCQAQTLVNELDDHQCKYRIPPNMAVELRKELLTFEDYLVRNEILLDNSGSSYQLHWNNGERQEPKIQIDTTLHFMDSIGTYVAFCVSYLLHENEKQNALSYLEKFKKDHGNFYRKRKKHFRAEDYEILYFKLEHLIFAYRAMADAVLSLGSLNLPNDFQPTWKKEHRKRIVYTSKGEIYVDGKYAGKELWQTMDKLYSQLGPRSSFLFVAPDDISYSELFTY